MKPLRIGDLDVISSVALTRRHYYNSAPEQRPAWTTEIHNATHRRLANGRGVFSAGEKQPMVAKILLAQFGLSVVLAMLFWGFDGKIAGYSVFLGGLTCVIPNAFLAFRLAVPRGDPGAGALVQAAYIGELVKLALTVLMFSMVFTLVRPLAAGALFAGFIAAQLMAFSGFLMRDKQTEINKRDTHGD